MIIWEGDEWKIFFNTQSDYYKYLVMPSGLSNAPAVFQVMVNDVLQDMISKFVYVYRDHILVFSQTKEEHVRRVHQVIQRLLEN